MRTGVFWSLPPAFPAEKLTRSVVTCDIKPAGPLHSDSLLPAMDRRGLRGLL